MSRNGKYIKRSRNVRLAGFSAAALLFIYALLAVFPVCFQDKDAEATIVPSETTLAIVSSKDTASVEITPTSGAGTFATSAAADKAEFTVTTDNLTGYSLNLVGSDTSGQLVNSTTGDTLDTLTADVAESTFRTGAASTYANRWGYQLNVNSTTTTNFLAAPTSATKTIYATTGPNTIADSYTLGVGARVDYSKPEGTYTNTFVLTAVGNPIPYELNYLDNTGPGGTTGADVSGLPSSEASSDATVASFVLSSSEPTRSGYSFIGWCYGTVTHPASGSSTCTGTVYQPGETFNFPNLSTTITNVANLYAMWNKPLIMQDLTTSMCAELASSSPIQVVDRRDGNDYQVRYINNNCWMTQNLRYVGDSGSTATSMMMKADTSNIASDKTLTIGDLTSGDDYNNARIHVATSGQVPSGLTLNDIGVWYNYAAASAGFVTSNQNPYIESTYSVCPAGWRLPTYSEQSGITSYMSQYFNGGTAVTGDYYYNGSVTGTGFGYWWSSTPNPGDSTRRYNLYYYESSLNTISLNRNYGLYVRCIRNTSSTTITFNGNGADGGSMDTQVINVTGSGNPSGTLNANTFTRDGYIFAGWNTAADGSGTSYANGATYTASTTGDTSVTLYAQWFSGSTIQDFTATTCASVASSNPVQVIDKRDGEIYYVQKLADGNCWLLDNLRLDPVAVSLDDLKGNTNATDQILTYLKNGGGSSPYPSSGVVARTASGGSWTNSYNLPFVYTAYKDTEASAKYGSGSGKIGVHYNYCAASAGSYCYASNAGSDNAQYDICPAGWRMPTTGTYGGQYPALYAAYNSNASDFMTALSTPTHGYFAGSAYYSDGNGYFWSSSSKDGSIMYSLVVGNLGVNYLDADGYRYIGYNIRCIRNSSSTTITFNGNGADGGSMDTQVINATGSGNPSGTLNANTFTRDGYIFTGWNTAANGSGTSYANGATYTASTTGDTSVTLYAQWAQISSYSMQDFTKSICSTEANSNVAYVADARDGNVYTVRYINGNCWMTQNLRYVGDTGSTAQSGSTAGSMIMKATTSNISVDTTISITDLTSSSPVTYDTSDYAKYHDSGNTTNGVWYNYAAASAMTITGGSNTSAQTYDICPKGWRLPTYPEQSGIISYTSQYSAVTGGFYYNGNVYDTVYGYWWSSTPNPSYSNDRYYLYGGSSLTTNSSSRGYGLYVRCVRSS